MRKLLKSSIVLGTVIFILFLFSFTVNADDSTPKIRSAKGSDAALFAIYDKDGDLIDKDGSSLADGGSLSDSQKFINAAKNAPSGSIIRLFSDITVNDAVTITFSDTRSLIIDLNGHKLHQVLKSTASKSLFSFSKDNSSLTIYSSRVGGEILSLNSSSTLTNALINVSGAAFTLNLGAYQDFPGSNLSVYSSGIIYAQDVSEKGVTVNIDGGLYVGNEISKRHLFNTVGTSTANFKNATFLILSNYNLITDGGHTASKLNAKIDGCNIFSLKEKSIVNENTSESTSVLISNSLLSGIMENSRSYKTVTFGKDVVFSAVLQESIQKEKFNYMERSALLPIQEETSLKIDYYDITVASSVYNYTKGEHEIKYTASHKIIPVDELLTTDTKANLTTKSGFLLNYYIPTAITEGSSVYTDPSYTEFAASYKTQMDGKYYSVYSMSVDPDNIKSINLYLHFVDLNGDTTEKIYSLSLYEYFNTVLSVSNNIYEKKLVISAANYCNEVYKYTSGEKSSIYDSILTEENKSLLTYDKNKLQEDAMRSDLSELQYVISGVTLYIGKGLPPIIVFVKVKDAALTITLNTLDGETTVSYPAAYSDYYYYTSYEFGIYDITSDLILTSGDSSCTYNLASYIYRLSDSSPAKELALAIYIYSLASREYVTN